MPVQRSCTVHLRGERKKRRGGGEGGGSRVKKGKEEAGSKRI